MGRGVVGRTTGPAGRPDRAGEPRRDGDVVERLGRVRDQGGGPARPQGRDPVLRRSGAPPLLRDEADAIRVGPGRAVRPCEPRLDGPVPATKAGLVPGNESPTVGPSSFDVDRRGRIYLLDALQDRLAVFGNGGLVQEARVVAGSRPDVAVADDGTAYVLSTQAGSSGAMLVQRIGPRAGLPDMTIPAGSGIPAAIRTAGDRAYVDALPLDAWVAVGRGGAAPRPANVRMGRPLGDGSELLTVVHGDAVRLAMLRGGTVEGAVELRSSVPLGEVALAEPDAHGGYVVVVHIWRDQPIAADQYQVIHVTPAGAVTAFAAANREFAETAPLSKFRLGKDGNLYEMTSSPDGVRIVRFQIGGES